jgi:cytidylate kinase
MSTNTIQQVIDRQIRQWIYEQQQRRDAREKSPQKGLRPWVAVSREFGAGAEEAARIIARDLGYQIFEHEIIDFMARESDFRRGTLEALDEKVQSGISLYVESLLHGHALSRSDFRRHLLQVVLGIGTHGHAVIVGHGATHILEPSGGLRVRFVAPFETRVAKVAEQRNLEQHDARELVLRTDREHERAIRTDFDCDVHDPSNYDVTINTAAFGYEGAARLAEAALREKMAGRPDLELIGSSGK